MEPQLILIDGYNVIRRTPALAVAERHGLEAARRALLGLVVNRYRGTLHRVYVVFDGDRARDNATALRCGIGSREIYSATGTTADDVIRRLVDEAREEWGERIRVFSDDWEVAAQAADQGARRGSVGDLTRHLTQAPRHLRKRAQHHDYLRQRTRADATEAPSRPHKGNAHKARRRRDR
jgi:predicted RNA-binding protein with PIN domain